MKIYGLATALAQTPDQVVWDKFGLSKTTVVYDSDTKKLEALHCPDKEEYGVMSSKGIKAMAVSLLNTIQEVVELQNVANREFGTDIKAPIIFGAAEEFNQGKLGSVVDKLPKTNSDSSPKAATLPLQKYTKKLSEFFSVNGVAETSYESFVRVAVLYKENRVSGYTQNELDSVVPTENLSDNRIDDIARDMASVIEKAHRAYPGETSISSLIFITPQKKEAGSNLSNLNKRQLSDLKALELSKENKRKFGEAFVRHCSDMGLTDQAEQPITIKTLFAPAARQFFDVAATEIAKIAAQKDPSLKGTMLNDFVYIPEGVISL